MSPRQLAIWSYAAADNGIASSATPVTIKAADANHRNYITGFQISWATLGAATEFLIRDGSSGTVIWRGTLPTVAGSLNVTLATPIGNALKNTILEVLAETSVTGGIFFNAQGFVGP